MDTKIIHTLSLSPATSVSFLLLRVFGRLVLIPFLEGRRSPNGLEVQQRAEITSEEVFSRASSAIGEVVGLSQYMDHIMKSKTSEVVRKLAQSECQNWTTAA